ncbi:F-box protein: endocytic membrane traffic, recycling ReCYcling 1 [Rhizophlyctis rosea]|nr:F-box protein: endocytic membrane traffic, recycling ReCYcling 1 [Rhizophlyctis rosea]
MSSKKSKEPPAPSGPPKNILSLPPDLVIRVFNFLPVPNLTTVACVSRRFKVLVYNDDLYEPKLKALGVEGANGGSSTLDAADEANIVARLKQLPGGHLLPGSTKYVGTGSLWGEVAEESGQGLDGSETKVVDGSDVKVDEEVAVASTTSTSPPGTPAGEPSTPSGEKSISAALPGHKKSSITVGAGGLKQAGKAQAPAIIGAGKVTSLRSARGARDLFRQVYTELLPYYLDFKTRQKDSKLFKDFKDVTEIATVLRRLRLFQRANFVSNTEDIDFALETTIEWFESMILGQFERAYDTQNIKEMQRNATAAYQLNGGAACVQVFISKNPIFFDETFNPSLVASKLPTAGGPAVGYALADDFAKYSDHMLNNCRKQARIVAQVFVPELDAMTLFVNKVFEDSISEYLSAVLAAARGKEGLGIYVHTLATAVHCCTQFLEFIAHNDAGVVVTVERVRSSVANIFKPYTENYIKEELEHMRKKFDTELEKWAKRKGTPNTKKGAAYLADQEKAQAHKRRVMSAMKTVMFAPIALTKTLTGNNKVKPSHKQSLLDDAEPVLAEAEKVDAVTYHLDDDTLNSLISLELCLHLMHTNKEALGRALVITSAVEPAKLRPNVEKVFIALLKAIGDRHITPAYNAAIDRLSKTQVTDEVGDKAVSMDSLQFFEMVHIGDLIQQMVDVYFNEDVKPWVDETDFLSDIVVEKKAFEKSLDDSVAHGMDKAIQVLISQVDFIMFKDQLPTDFNPSEKDAFVLDVKPTKACTKAIETLNSHTKLLSGATEKNTMEVFLTEVGVRVFAVIIKNLKRQQISQAGAMQLICDFNKYYEWAVSTRVSAISRQFQVLKELGKLYLSDGNEELRKLVHDLPRFQGVLRIEEIYELLQSRTDYKKIQKFVESKECLVM